MRGAAARGASETRGAVRACKGRHGSSARGSGAWAATGERAEALGAGRRARPPPSTLQAPSPPPPPPLATPRHGPVLLASFEGLAAETLVSIECLHSLFSSAGHPLRKITLFDKGHGLQAMLQFAGPAEAASARAALDGRALPPSLLPSPHPPVLRLAPSPHANLNVRFQSHRSRDFGDASLPAARAGAGGGGGGAVADLAPPPGSPAASLATAMAAPGAGSGGGKVLRISFERALHPVTPSALAAVTAPYGPLARAALFDGKQGGVLALVEFGGEPRAAARAAAAAAAALEGRPMFTDGANVMRVAPSTHGELSVRVNGDRGWDWTREGGRGGGQATGPSSPPAADSAARPTAPPPSGLDYEAAHEAAVKAARASIGVGTAAGAARWRGPPVFAPPPPW